MIENSFLRVFHAIDGEKKKSRFIRFRAVDTVCVALRNKIRPVFISPSR